MRNLALRESKDCDRQSEGRSLTYASSECIVVMTGPTDWISDGVSVATIENGHSLLPNITGSGCMVGSAIASCCAAVSVAAEQARNKEIEDGKLTRGDMLAGVIAGFAICYHTVPVELRLRVVGSSRSRSLLSLQVPARM